MFAPMSRALASSVACWSIRHELAGGNSRTGLGQPVMPRSASLLITAVVLLTLVTTRAEAGPGTGAGGPRDGRLRMSRSLVLIWICRGRPALRA